jgi:hypothetical protein
MKRGFMKKFIILSSIVSTVLFALQAPASTPATHLQFSCATEFPSTTFIGETIDKVKLKVTFINHNGVEYMPIHSGLLTTNDLKAMLAKSELMTKIGDYAKFTFDLANCDLHKDKTFSCFRGSTLKGTDGKDIQVFTLMSSFTDQKFSDYEYKQTSMLLGLIIDGQSLYIPMDYQRNECDFVSKP